MTNNSRPDLRPHLVKRLLKPRSIAVIGVSSKPGAPGQVCAALLERDGFSGPVHLVGRNVTEVGKRQTITNIGDLPKGIDLAVLAMPAVGVADAVRECVAREIGGAVVFASGFAEAGGDAKSAQEALTDAVAGAEFGIAGPNSFGLTNYVDAIDIGFIPGRRLEPLAADRLPGVAIIAQSGAMLVHAQSALAARSVPVSYRLSAGNEADLDLADYVAYLAGDAAVGTIALYAEHIRRPRQFLDAIALAQDANKNVVMLHAGRGQRAQQAAASHTGAIAGDYAVMETLVSDAGVLLVRTVEELVDCAEVLHRYPVPPSLAPAVVTTSGAMCAVTLDACDDVGLDLPVISAQAQSAIMTRLPPFSPPVQNPVDLTSLPDLRLIADATKALADDPAVGSVLIAVPAGGGNMAIGWLRPLTEILPTLDKPVFISVLGEEEPLPDDFMALIRAKGLLLTRSPERSLRAIAAVTGYGRLLTRSRSHLVPADLGDHLEGVSAILPEWKGKALLRSLGIDVPLGKLAASVDEATRIAADIGYPVVLKVQSAQLAHKTEAGAVALDIADEKSLCRVHADLVDRVRRHHPDIVIDGVLVEGMASKGLEFVVGAKRDPQWGPALLVGLGGIYVELLRDVRLLPVDLTPEEIEAELRQLKGAGLFDGFRGGNVPDLAAVAQVVSAIGCLMASCPQISEIDINPLVAFGKGSGVIALDALIALGADAATETDALARVPA